MKDWNLIKTILFRCVPTWTIAVFIVIGAWTNDLTLMPNLVMAIILSLLVPAIAYFLTIPPLRASRSCRKEEGLFSYQQGHQEETKTEVAKTEVAKTEEIQKPGTYDPMHIRHMVKRLQELNGKERLQFIPFQDLCLRANKEYERVSKDLAMGITNYYLLTHHYPAPEKLAQQTGCNIHYCYALLQEYKKQMGERLAKLADQKNVTAQDILYETYTVNEKVRTNKIIGYTEKPYTSCSTLIEESCYMNSGGHYEHIKEPIYEYKNVQRNVKEYQLQSIFPFVPFDFQEKVKNRWNDLSIEEELNFDLLQHYVSIVYSQPS